MKDIKINNEKIRIVIIDSGIDTNETYLRNSIKEETGFKLNEKLDVVEEHNPKIKNDHGTVIAKTIKYICNEVEFISINILDENLSTDGRVLIQALKKSMSYKPHIVHLRLGTTKIKYWYPLKKLCKFLNKNNVIIVSAANNEGKRSYPAYLKEVIGVKGANVNNTYLYNDKFFYASLGLPNDLCINNKRYKDLRGNSISAGYMTGYICRAILGSNNKSNKEVIEYLKNEGLKNYYNIYLDSGVEL
jgi:hypothetical protein